VHGWNHTNYINLTEDNQKLSLEDARNKMIKLFSKASELFIPPYNAFNDDTLNAMRQIDMKIIDGNASSINQLQLKGNNNSNSSKSSNQSAATTASSSQLEAKKIFYITATISFKDYYGGKYLRNSDESILNNVTQSISAHGYAVVVIHPQDFVQIAANGSLTPAIDNNEINDFSSLIDLISSNHIPLGSFSKIIAAGHIQSNNTQKYPIH
jgi:peptidoglycan/xylan/chitin deacetylase (PgdA/CDA1 family)